ASKVRAGLAEADWHLRRGIIGALINHIEVPSQQVTLVFRSGPQPAGPWPPSDLLRHCLVRHATLALEVRRTCYLVPLVAVVGTLLKAEIEIQRLATGDNVQQRLEGRWRRGMRPGAPAPLDDAPGIKPALYLAQGARPGRRPPGGAGRGR